MKRSIIWSIFGWPMQPIFAWSKQRTSVKSPQEKRRHTTKEVKDPQALRLEEKIEAKLKFSQWEFEFGFLMKLHSKCSTPWAWVLFTPSSPKVLLSQKKIEWFAQNPKVKWKDGPEMLGKWWFCPWRMYILRERIFLPVGTRSAFGHYGQRRNEMPCQVRAILLWEILI